MPMPVRSRCRSLCDGCCGGAIWAHLLSLVRDHGAFAVAASPISVRLVSWGPHQLHPDGRWSNTRCTVIRMQPHQTHPDPW